MEVSQGYKQTEIGLLPNDWNIMPLGECLINNPQYGIGASAVTYSLNLPTYLRITDISDDGKFLKDNQTSVDNIFAKNYFLEDGDLVFARTGASVGKSYLYNPEDGPLVFAGFLIRVKPDRNKLNPYYLKYYTQSYIYWCWVNQTSMRSGQPGINGNEYRKLPIPLPPTKQEQTAISQVLSDTDELISSLEKLIEKKKLIKQGTMLELLKPKEDWEEKTLIELATYRRGTFPQPYGLDRWYDDNSGFPFVQVFDVDDNMKLKEETKRKISVEAQKLSLFIKKDSIILTIQGSIGRIALTQYDCYMDRTLLYFESFRVPFNKYFFMISVFLLFEQEKQKAPGGTIKTITKEALSSFSISYPPIEEQNRIAEILTDMDSEIETLAQKLNKYKSIKQGMMQNLLTGKIRLVGSIKSAQIFQLHSNKPKHNWEIDEAVIISILIKLFGNQKFPLGRKRYQKIKYLFQKYAKKDVKGYLKKAAGPYNPKTKYKGPEKIAQSNKYIKYHTRENYSGFIAAENINEAVDYFNKWYGQDKIEWLEQFRYVNNDKLELWTTVDFAIEDLSKENKEISLLNIKEIISNNKEWRDKLKRPIFSDNKIESAIEKLHELFDNF